MIPDNLLPLVYLIACAAIAGALYYLSVPAEMIGLIVGAGITRVKVSSTPTTPTSETTTTKTTSTTGEV